MPALKKRHGAEKVAENIIEDFFTVALDWSIETFNHQLNRAYMVLSRLGQKRLLIEAKRPESLAPASASLDKALIAVCPSRDSGGGRRGRIGETCAGCQGDPQTSRTNRESAIQLSAAI
jgi:hypothetical protein